MVELIFGHDFFGAVWYPAYESFLQVDSFAAALAEALVRVRCCLLYTSPSPRDRG